MTALFLMAPAYGHLNATYRLARQLQTEGYQVIYALNGPPELAHTVKQQGFSIHWLQSRPFGVGLDAILNHTRTESYLETLFDRISGRDLKARTADWHIALATLKPTLILLDTFLSTDFIVVYPLLKTHPATVVLIQTMLSSYNDGHTPPLNSLLIPGKDSNRRIRNAWRKQYLFKNLWRLEQTIKYFGFGPQQQVRRAFRQNGLPDEHRLRTDKLFHAGIDNLPEWIMAPGEFDFANRQLLPHQQYLGLMPDLERSEERLPTYERLITKLEQERLTSPNLKLLYVSLGTVTNAHAKPRVLLRFFEQLLLTAATQSNWRLIMVIDADLATKLTNPPNVYSLTKVPQLHLLRQCDLFITHGGLNSVLEATVLNVPMLVYPLNSRWDQLGNAARVMAHGKGQVGNLRKINAIDMTKQILECLAMIRHQTTS